jgi:Tol biopolymer transport system component
VPIPTPSSEVVVQSGSPDGSELLVTDGGLAQDGPMWVLPVVAGSPRRLGDAVGHDGSWSPDGRKIVYVATWRRMLLRATVKPFRVSLVEPVAYLSDSYEPGRPRC